MDHIPSKTPLEFYRYLEFLARMVVGQSITVRPVPQSDAANAEENKELSAGYTNASRQIYVAWEHPFMKGLTEREKDFFRIGIFTHEVLHLLLTDFRAMRIALDDAGSIREREMIQTFANLVEDPAIEYFAPVPRLMRLALRFVVEWTFYCAPPLETGETPLIQLINALVMYGDTGKLKGKFTFPEAERCYREIIPEFVMEISDPDASFRPLCAKSWTEIARPLWEGSGDTAESLGEFMRKHAKSMAVGTDEPMCSLTEPEEEKRECIRIRMEECREGDGTPGTEDSGSDESTESGIKESGTDETADERAGRSGKEGTASFSEGDAGADHGMDKTWTVTRRPVLGEEDERLLESAESVIMDMRKDLGTETTRLPSYSESAAGGDRVPFTVRNTPVMDEVEEWDGDTYDELRKKLAGTPDALAKVLRELMRRHTGRICHSTHGRLNVRRWAAGMSQHIFDRKVRDKDCGDAHIFLAIDLSGSMGCNRRIDAARDVAIIFAETCHKLRIPLMVMGYTAETERERTLDHYHYVRTGSEKERVSLVKIRAMAQNADGYSFRYLEQEVLRSKAEKKIVLILTDGLPESPRFYGEGKRDAHKDTKDAFNRLKRSANVLAFGLGTSEDWMKPIYGNCFVQVDNVSMLPQIVANRFKQFF